jgi:hypothetical protein
MGILRRNGHVAHEHPPEAAAAPVVPEGVEVQPAPAWVAEAPAWVAVERLEHFFLEHTPDYVRSQTERPPAQLDGLRRTIRDAEEQTRPVAPATTEEDT